ncbi:hypothetical protein BXZ70DRAFT_937278 [Cristinia sonorae]|uniref:Secreted protein n=1 Tax=Cristinia sonorae TaxID=1940300 RepID=A0A8K0XPX7_9AGAR|nr:hypothetical protein BXZ70DRAFT_937278 [Cristinia sonorae]
MLCVVSMMSAVSYYVLVRICQSMPCHCKTPSEKEEFADQLKPPLITSRSKQYYVRQCQRALVRSNEGLGN